MQQRIEQKSTKWKKKKKRVREKSIKWINLESHLIKKEEKRHKLSMLGMRDVMLAQNQNVINLL